MKRNLIILFCAFFISVSVFSASKSKSQKLMYVAVEKLDLKNKASITAKQTASLDYGSRVIILDEKGSWCKIQLLEDDSINGWVNSGSLTKKKIIVASSKVGSSADDEIDGNSGKRVSTNASELSLAGKGFNSAVEAAYEDEFDVNFALVDQIEKNGVSEEDTIAFIIEGNLRLDE